MLQILRPKSAYARNVITLLTGTSIAQAIPIAVSPILTRLYTPADFGVFALYMAIVSIVSVIVTGRYELAIMLPRKESDAINIMALSAVLSCVISATLFVVIVLFNSQITKLLGTSAVSTWLYAVPLSTLVTGIYQSLNYWSNRKGNYRRMVTSRVLQNGGTSIGQMGGGYSSIGAVGLVGGQLIGQVLSTAVLTNLIYREDKGLAGKINRNQMYALAKKYSKFPKYLILAHGFNTGSAQMPIVLLSSLFSSATAGFYTLTQRVFGAPMTLVAGAIGDVFRQEASQAYALTGNCKLLYEKAFKQLLYVSTLPFLIFFFLSPQLFTWVFGDPWKTSGEYAQILTPMFFLRFITSPLSQMAVIAQKQRVDLVWQVVLFVLVILSLMIGYLLENIKLGLILFSMVYCLMYAMSGLLNYWFSSGSEKSLATFLR